MVDKAFLLGYNALKRYMYTRGYLGVYGAVILPKAWCEECQTFSLVRRGVLVCCDERVAKAPELWKRESQASGIRQKPSAEYRKAQLERQSHRCFYCELLLGESIRYCNRLVTLRTHWDHVVPFAYLQSNPDKNFVAACHICNNIKAAKVFQTVEEAKSYVQTKKALRNARVSELR